MSDVADDIRALWDTMYQVRSGAAASTPIGTSFPTTAVTGMLFFRSDFNWLMVYDGTQWITVHELPVVITYSTDLTATYSATTNAVRRGLMRNSHKALLIRGEIFTGLAAGTSDSSNYWTISVVAVDNAATVWSFDTKTDSAGANTLHTTTSFSQPSAAESTLRIDLAKTSAPPNISILGAVLFYRIILT